MDTQSALSFMPVRLRAWYAAMNSHSFSLGAKLSRADAYLARTMLAYVHCQVPARTFRAMWHILPASPFPHQACDPRR